MDQEYTQKLNNSVIGLTTGPYQYIYTWRDVALYALSVGAGPEELEYVYEKEMKGLPSFGVVPYTATFHVTPPIKRARNPAHTLDYLHRTGILYMEHELIIHKPINPLGGTWTYTPTLTELYDRGADKGAKIVTREVITDETGEEVCTNVAGVLYRFDGGFGGQEPPKKVVNIPDRKADFYEEVTIPENAALLYRLNGDVFELHADPEFAKQAGFERPILHGICTYGYACRIAIKHIIPKAPERMTRMYAQFRSPVTPGDRLRMDIWKLNEARAAFIMTNQETGKLVLGAGEFEWK